MELEKAAGLPPVIAARKFIRQLDADMLADMIELVQIPAPPFGEAERARWLRQRLIDHGLADAGLDEIGNVIAHVPGSGSPGEAAVMVSAHLDTVFDAQTPLQVTREGQRVAAPGIADNARGLAALLAIARTLCQHPIATQRPIVMAATVGEEGVGDLRGVKHLFRTGSPWRSAAAFITIDGTGSRRIVCRAIGSRRFAITIQGPGGHSWADWGLANPVDAMGQAIARLGGLELSRQPRATLTVARVGGGTSVNAIPAQAWMEIDLRAEAGATLLELEGLVRDLIGQAVDATNARRRRGSRALELDIRLIGDRPTGETATGSALVRAARTATRMVGEPAELVASSTDANVPIALGVPAIAIGAGGQSGGTHTTEEWYVNEGGPAGAERALLTVLGAAVVR